jgi:hypothetical protein
MRIFLVSIISILLASCGLSQGTSTGNPLVSLKFDAFNSSLAVQKVSDVGASTVSNLTMCFKRLRFKTASETTNPDPTQDSDNIDFYLGDVSISSLGTNLEDVHLPAGTYERIEFDLDDDCPSGKSVQLTNSHGTYSTTDRMTIKFEGTFVHNGSNAELGLEIQQIVSALNTVNNANDIKDTAEGVDGSF